MRRVIDHLLCINPGCGRCAPVPKKLVLWVALLYDVLVLEGGVVLRVDDEGALWGTLGVGARELLIYESSA
jgi:hypothetical protein